MELFETWDTAEWFMWEWGSGGSTKWFGERVKKLWSMEHDKDWYSKTKRDCKDMEHVYLMHKPLGGDYVKEITRFPDQFFDCILVDGRNRTECVKAAARKARKVVMLDNALRGEYAGALQFMEHQQVWKSELVKWAVPNKAGVIKKSWHTMIWERQ